ncbi:MAG: hypothetical protein LKJ21_05635 [Oscillospiraceae bacterium]|nr:hypothetical protein [Oscillospiraceae bacterium]MCI1989901.1 hypothetical protein [Oscillospiraceae bacterium]MCI2034619.1 hypothetical protein [Oscillospiraceae bacterium]
MRSKGNGGPKIKVKMFGEFSISVNGNALSNFKGNTKRVWLLIQYLLAHRFQAAPVNLLVAELWDGKQCGDPKNALKNLVYRARSLLKELSRNAVAQFILFEDGTYRWNNRYDCEIDTERFLENFHRGEDASLPGERRIAAYEGALALYQGAFLQKSSYSGWVVACASDFAGIYQECVKKICGLYFERRRYDDAAKACENALAFLPYEVAIHRLLLRAYLSGGRRSEASRHYRKARDLFYCRFGVDLSASLRTFCEEVVNHGAAAEADISAVVEDLKEEDGGTGAYYCNYDVFRAVCRIQLRMASRTGEPVFLAMFTLRGAGGAGPGPEDPQLAEKLRSSILTGLRSADIVAPYSSTRFLVLLPLASFQDARQVVQRIEKKFRFVCRRDDVVLSTEIGSLT